MRGKRVVVTGASSGIGEQMAYHYARLGARLLITSRTEAKLQKVTSCLCQFEFTKYKFSVSFFLR